MAEVSKSTQDIINYIVACVSEFADRYNLSRVDAYIFLRDYKGLEYLQKFYYVEHLCSFDETVDALTIICKKHGGSVS
ncbi:MAG: DUF3791 domain-containing protein [Clostridia bacterium]|nr:DUF3791 domain-containing protein [Clostridia bacterium]